MKVRLMHPDHDFDVDVDLPAGAGDVVQDLQLQPMFAAMSRGDTVIGQVTRRAVLTGLTHIDEVRYRQQVLRDCDDNRDVVHELYKVSLGALNDERNVYRGALSAMSERSEPKLSSSVSVLAVFVERLRQLRGLAVRRGSFSSPGFVRFWDQVEAEIDDDYLALIDHHLARLKRRDGLLVSAHAGEGNQVAGFVLRTPDLTKRTMFHRTPLDRPTFSYTVPDRDEATSSALGELRDHVLREVATAVAEAADHVLDFFLLLRDELAFYFGCLNLLDSLHDRDVSTVIPDVSSPRGRQWSAHGLVDPALALTTRDVLVGNNFDTKGKPLIVVTGANRGGKSTFLRSLGTATLMSQAGMFVAAEAYSGPLASAVHTHFKREEDASMRHGKFDEELARMSRLADRVVPDALVLSNESFAATNEREGADIGEEVFTAMLDSGVRVCLVTHMFEFAERFRRNRERSTLFLRAQRDDDGSRSYRLAAAPPLRTSYAADLYREVFGPPREPTPAG
jgi:DNA mismatch repair ATPase MutS